MKRKIETKIVTALIFSHSDNLKPWIKCHGSNTPSPLPPPPPRCCISLVLSIEFSNRTCNVWHNIKSQLTLLNNFVLSKKKECLTIDLIEKNYASQFSSLIPIYISDKEHFVFLSFLWTYNFPCQIK